MRHYFDRFLRDDSGAVTVDWVVLTAFMVGFGFAIALIISTAAQDPADGLGAHLTAMEIQS
jgi:Flp pilus assembly pilin Flp